MLTGIKDLDYKILNELNDVDLTKALQVNKQADNICKDQAFWFNRIIQRFPTIPIHLFHQYKGDRSWSDYYIYDLIKNNTY